MQFRDRITVESLGDYYLLSRAGAFAGETAVTAAMDGELWRNQLKRTTEPDGVPVHRKPQNYPIFLDNAMAHTVRFCVDRLATHDPEGLYGPTAQKVMEDYRSAKPISPIFEDRQIAVNVSTIIA